MLLTNGQFLQPAVLPLDNPSVSKSTLVCLIESTAAKNFRQLYKLEWPVYVAPMDSSFEQMYQPWPIGMYLLENQSLSYAAGSSGSSFDLLGLQNALGE